MTATPFTEHQDDNFTRIKNTSMTVVHLPVSPQVVSRTRFSPPPPSRSQCLMVPEAMNFLEQIMEKRQTEVSMIAISGPGDPLATPDITLNIAEQVRRKHPQIPIGLKTAGIGSQGLAADMFRAGVNFVEMQIDGVQAEIIEKLYAWIRPGSKTMKLSEAADLLLKEQRNGVSALKFNNIAVSILTTLYPGYNIDHVAKISAQMMEVGADSISLVPYVPEPGAEVDLDSPSQEAVTAAVTKAGTYLQVVEPVLLQPFDPSDRQPESLTAHPELLPKPSRQRPNVAVVSSNGIEVDLHLGQANKFLIYGPREDGLPCLLEAREAPKPGAGANRWQEAANTLEDCFSLLVASAGETPRRVLAENGLKVLIIEDNIEGNVDVLYGGGKKGKHKNK